MVEVRKAVFPVAGFGTRFLPATKAMPKELLPVIDKPLIQYAAEEAIAAGIDTLIFVTGRNKRAIEDHFDGNLELETSLRASGNIEKAEMVRNILPEGVECIFVRQPEQIGLGNAVLCAERAVGNEPFAVLLADDFLYRDTKGETESLISAFKRSRKTQLSVMKVDEKDVHKYGIIALNKEAGSVCGLIEKPDMSEAPSDLASVGRYILTPEIFSILKTQVRGKTGEYQLTDALNVLAKLGQVEANMLNSVRFDCGSVDGYLDAITYAAGRRQ